MDSCHKRHGHLCMLFYEREKDNEEEKQDLQDEEEDIQQE